MLKFDKSLRFLHHYPTTRASSNFFRVFFSSFCALFTSSLSCSFSFLLSIHIWTHVEEFKKRLQTYLTIVVLMVNRGVSARTARAAVPTIQPVLLQLIWAAPTGLPWNNWMNFSRLLLNKTKMPFIASARQTLTTHNFLAFWTDWSCNLKTKTQVMGYRPSENTWQWVGHSENLVKKGIFAFNASPFNSLVFPFPTILSLCPLSCTTILSKGRSHT